MFAGDQTPCITSHLPSIVVHTRLLLVSGIVPDVESGDLQITPHRNHIPTQSIPIRDGQFKALIPLAPGENEVQLLYYSSSQNKPFIGYFFCTYTPNLNNPPLKLVIILGRDSTGTYDDTPNARHPPTLETAIKKLRLAGYIWAAYTSNEMSDAGFGHRTFRLDETWQADTLSRQSTRSMQTATIHVLRSKYSVAEIRDPERAQQNHQAGSASGLFDIALQTLRENPSTNNVKEYVAALFLDSHADPSTGLITGHAALGGGTAQHALAIFGSHSLFAWPAHLEDLHACFSDPAAVDKAFTGIDGEGRFYYAACSVGIGAMMREVGHLFGCPHQESGVMRRDYPRLHRSLTVLEPEFAGTVVGRGECHWHRLDLLRFLGHPCFALASDSLSLHETLTEQQQQTAPTCLATAKGLYITCASGVKLLEFTRPGTSEFPFTSLDHHATLPTTLFLPTNILPLATGDSDLCLTILGYSNESLRIPDLRVLQQATDIAGIGQTFTSPILGLNRGTSHFRQLFSPGDCDAITIHSGACLDGLEFVHRASSRHQVSRVGTQGGRPSEFLLLSRSSSPTTTEEDGERGGGGGERENLIGFIVRSGLWIDAIQFITDRQTSKVYGNPTGGTRHELRCPPGHRVCGVVGEVGDWIVRFGMIYTEIPSA